MNKNTPTLSIPISITLLLCCCTLVFLWYSSFTHSQSNTAPHRASDEQITPQMAANETWGLRGVGGGGALYMPSINPHQPKDVYLSTDMSAVYRSQNFGKTWQTLHFKQLTGSSHAVVRFTQSPEVQFAINTPGEYSDYATHLKKSLDGGQSWHALPFKLPADIKLKALFTDLHSTQHLITSTAYQAYLSLDGGQHFHELLPTSIQKQTATDLILAGVVWQKNSAYLFTSRGIFTVDFKNINQLRTKRLKINGIKDSEAIVAFDSASNQGDHRWVAITAKKSSVRADSTPEEWQHYQGVYELVIHQDNKADALPASLLPTTLATRQWKKVLHKNQVSPSLTVPFSQQDLYFSSVGMAANNTDTIYLGGTDLSREFPVLLKSVDGGASWSSVLQTVNNKNILTAWAGYKGDTDWWFGNSVHGLSVSDSDPNYIVISDAGFVHVSHNGGESWQQAYSHPLQAHRYAHPTPKNKSYQTNGMSPTSSWWITWSNPQDLFIAMTDITSMSSYDAGVSWQRNSLNGLTYNTIYHIVKDAKKPRLYAASSSVHDLYQETYLQSSKIDHGTGAVMYSDNQGKNWHVLYDFNMPVIWLALSTQNPDHLYASVVNSQKGGIYLLNLKTRKIIRQLTAPPGTQGHPYNIYSLNDGSLLSSYSGTIDEQWQFNTASAGIFISRDQGQSWKDVSIPSMKYWAKDIRIDPHDASQNTWYAAIHKPWGNVKFQGYGGLYRTKNKGQSWDKISDVERVESVTINPDTPNHMYMTSYNQGLLETHNLKHSKPQFKQVKDYPFKHPMRVFFNPYKHNEVWVTSFGGGVRVLEQ